MDIETLKTIFKAKQKKGDRRGRPVAGFKNVSLEQFYDWFNMDTLKRDVIIVEQQSIEVLNCIKCRETILGLTQNEEANKGESWR